MDRSSVKRDGIIFTRAEENRDILCHSTCDFSSEWKKNSIVMFNEIFLPVDIAFFSCISFLSRQLGGVNILRILKF